MIEYKSYDYTRTIPVDDYILRYRDERRFMAYCRECRRYGNSWSCPPFNDSEDYLSGFRNLLIVCTRITPVVLDVPDAVEAGQELMHRERSRLDKRLLALGGALSCPWRIPAPTCACGLRTARSSWGSTASPARPRPPSPPPYMICGFQPLWMSPLPFPCPSSRVLPTSSGLRILSAILWAVSFLP